MEPQPPTTPLFKLGKQSSLAPEGGGGGGGVSSSSGSGTERSAAATAAAASGVMSFQLMTWPTGATRRRSASCSTPAPTPTSSRGVTAFIAVKAQSAVEETGAGTSPFRRHGFLALSDVLLHSDVRTINSLVKAYDSDSGVLHPIPEVNMDVVGIGSCIKEELLLLPWS